jgi:hypothetical protein
MNDIVAAQSGVAVLEWCPRSRVVADDTMPIAALN